MILVVGDVMQDVIVRPRGQPAPGTDQAASIARRYGGSAANIACWLGDSDVPTRFAGRVGVADRVAHEAAFRAHGVEPVLAGDVERETGAVVALLGKDGQRSFFTDRGANLALCAADLPAALLEGVRALHISGHVFFEAGPRAAARTLMRRAQASDIEISVDAGSAGWLAGMQAVAFRAWTEGAELCFANAEEAGWVGGDFTTVVVTLGAAGSALRRGGEEVRMEAVAAEVRDGTGAGDAFAAGFLEARLRRKTHAACLAAGAQRAAICVATLGGRPAREPGKREPY